MGPVNSPIFTLETSTYVSLQLIKTDPRKSSKHKNDHIELRLARLPLEGSYRIASELAPIMNKPIFWDLTSPSFYGHDYPQNYKIDQQKSQENLLSEFVGTVTNPSKHNVYARKFVFDDMAHSYRGLLFFIIAGLLFVFVLIIDEFTHTRNPKLYDNYYGFMLIYFLFLLLSARKTVIEIDGNTFRVGWTIWNYYHYNEFPTNEVHAIVPENQYLGR